MPHRILRDLHEHGLARLQCELDAPRLSFETARVPVDLTGVQDRVATAADVDERGLHAGQHVLHPAEVDVARVRRALRPRDEVFDEDAVFEDGDLGAVLGLAYDHDALDRLAAGQELRFGEDRGPATGFASFAATLLAGFQPGRTADAAHRIGVTARLTHADNRVGRVVGRGRKPITVAARRTTTTAAAPGARGGPVARGLIGVPGGVPRIGFCGFGGVGCRVRGLPAALAATPAAPAPAARCSGRVGAGRVGVRWLRGCLLRGRLRSALGGGRRLLGGRSLARRRGLGEVRCLEGQ